MAHQSLERTWFVTKFAGDFGFVGNSLRRGRGLSLDDLDHAAFVGIGGL